MSQAAYEKKIAISAAPPAGESFSNVPAVSATLNHGGDVLDDTDMVLPSGDPNFGFRSRILGLRDASCSITANYDAASAVLTQIRDAWKDKLKLLVRYLPDGTTANGFEFEGPVESFSITSDINGLVTVDISIQASSLLAAA